MSVSRTFAALSILLVAVGLYAMLTLALRQRQHDVAICLALGAPLYRAAAFVFRRESMWAIGGAMLGLGAFPSFAASLRRLVHGVSDVALLAYVQVLLVVVGCWVLAMVGPVRRLLGSDISEALREE